jgi:hypothetical protein
MKPYPLFRKENLPAYLLILSTWAVLAVTCAATLVLFAESLSFVVALIWAGVTVMLGMAIMFVASAMNLRKLAPGFKRLAEGQQDPQIPPVWCPVLTAATNAALELQHTLRESNEKQATKNP